MIGTHDHGSRKKVSCVVKTKGLEKGIRHGDFPEEERVGRDGRDVPTPWERKVYCSTISLKTLEDEGAHYVRILEAETFCRWDWQMLCL